MSAPMTCDDLALTLADFLEGDVDDATRERIEAHAARCGDCGRLLSDLRALRVAAAALPALAPRRDLWAGIEERIQTPVVELKNNHASSGRIATVWRRRTWIGLAAAGLVAVTATITHRITARSIALHTAATAPVRSADSGSDVLPVANRADAEAAYDQEIARLRDILNKRRPELDTATVAVVEHNLAVIDTAIAQCAQALRKDPASRFLIESLNDALRSKVQLLRTATTLSSRS